MENLQSGLELTWRDVSFDAPYSRTEMGQIRRQHGQNQLEGQPSTHKNILSHVSGRLIPRSFTAILGASGSGKTTLLNFLSNRRCYLKKLRCSGEVYVNGRSRSEVNLNSFIAYVMQDDMLIETMTVREILTFTAKMRLSPETYMRKMSEIVDQLELTKVLDSRIGGVLNRGISGGERRRVTIAMEILTDPMILFLDEPTTGLDSYNAENVISVCRKLTEMGKTVCCTIHQPNSLTFSLFHNVLFLADHRIVYNGPNEQLVDYFGGKGFMCPQYTNPADYVVKTLSEPENVMLFPAVHDTSIIETRDLPDSSSHHIPTFSSQLRLLIPRSFQNFVRNQLLMKFMITSKLLFIFIFLSAFWQIAGENDARSVTNRGGFLVFFLVSSCLDAVSSMGGYFDEKGQYTRDQANQIYSPLAYFLSKLLGEVPFDLAIIAVYEAVIYAGIGLSFAKAEQVFIFIFICMIVYVNGKGWCFTFLFAFETVHIAAAVTPFVVIIQFLFAGFFINYANIPYYLYELLYFSIFKYTWSAAVINEFDSFDMSECRKSSSSEVVEQCDAVDYYNIELSLWGNIFVAIAHTIAINLLAYFSLKRVSKAFSS